VRRFATIALSTAFLLGLTATDWTLAQDAAKTEAPKAEPPKTEAAKPEAPKAEAPKAEPALPPIPPEVEAKLEAARRAVAEAIVAAQDAGLVQTSIDPPPILDILITGRATDEAALKAKTGVSPEVFGAWFTGQGKVAGVVIENDVRILPPSAGLRAWYDERKNILNKHIKAVRDAKAAAEKPKEEPKAEEPKKEEKKEEVKKEEPKAEEPKKEEKKEEPKAEEPKKEEPKADAPKVEEPKADAPKAEEPKADAPKAEEPKKEEPKAEEPKTEAKKEVAPQQGTQTAIYHDTPFHITFLVDGAKPSEKTEESK